MTSVRRLRKATGRIGPGSALALWILIGSLAPVLAQAAPEPAHKKVIVVLDASGSMWGEVDGRPKIEIAREVLGDLLKDWNPGHELGLTVYGHRSKGDCKDIQNIIPVAKVDRARFMKTVKGIQPKGRTPLSLAVQQAAQALRFEENPAEVILISDGKESCDMDPCAMGRELRKSGVDFHAHVIGFDVAASDEQAQLRCLAQNTGGEFLLAKDAASLKEALGAVVERATEEAPPGLRPRALMVPGGPPLTKGVWWDVFAPEKDLDGKRKRLEYTSKALPTFELAPGKYVVRAKVDEAVAEAEAEIQAGRGAVVEVVLNAGRIKAQMYLKPGDDPIAKDTWWDVFAPEKDLDGKRKRLLYTSAAAPLWTLNAGTYVIRAKSSLATAEREVEVRPGQDQRLEIPLNAGRIKLRGHLKAGDDPITAGTWWEVYDIEEDINGERERLAYTSASSPVFTLTAGRYVIAHKHDNARATQEIEINAGEERVVDLALNAGQIKVRSVQSNGRPATGRMWWEVYEGTADVAGERERIAYTSTSSPLFTLPAGDYVVEVKNDDKTASRSVTVKSGAVEKIDFVLK